MPRAEPTEKIRKLEENRARINAEIQRVKGRGAARGAETGDAAEDSGGGDGV